jgi:hypothetical protein
MGILARAFSQKGVTVADLPAEILQLGQSKSGQSVTIANALKVSTVCACVRRIAEGMAQVSLKLYIEDDQDNKRPLVSTRCTTSCTGGQTTSAPRSASAKPSSCTPPYAAPDTPS